MIYLLSILLVSGTLALFAALLVVAERKLLRYGPCAIEIDRDAEGAPARKLVVEGGQDLLTALAEEGIYLPSLCGRRGTCGYCKVRVLSGGGPALPTELLYLTQDELRSGTRLACQVKVREDLRLCASGTLLAAASCRARVSGVLALTPAVREIRLRLEDPARLAFSPGQYIQVEIPAGGDEPVFRAYSVASPVYETAELALDVERVPGGAGSTWLHRLEPGDVVHFIGPYGEFRISEDPEVEVVCVAGGCGLAPMKSIIYSVLDRWPRRTCRLFYGFRSAPDAFYLQVYQRLAKEYPNFRFAAAAGLIHETVERELATGPRRQAFLCGPPEMVEAVVAALRRKGVEHIYFDAF